MRTKKHRADSSLRGVCWPQWMLVCGGADKASAFTTSDRDACWSAWTNAFLLCDPATSADISGIGKAAPVRCHSGSLRKRLKSWKAPRIIQASKRTWSTRYVPGLPTSLERTGPGNSFNDDLMWASIAFSRAYLLTGNATYRTLAKNGFDLAYSRGWDPTDGGIFQDTSGFKSQMHLWQWFPVRTPPICFIRP